MSLWREPDATMRYFPLFADLGQAHVLVVGGGEQATQKVRLLRKTSAHITVVAQAVTDELRELGEQSAIWIIPRAFLPRDLDGQRLVHAATGDPLLDVAVSRAAKKRGIPVNVVDAPALSTFIMPAIVDRDPVTVAIGTEGAAPVLAREIKSLLETLLPANFGLLARRAQGLRDIVAKAVPDAPSRRRIWERLLQGPFRRAVLRGAEAEAGQILAAELRHGEDRPAASHTTGRVTLIGCGPGDPDLLTLKAVQRLQEADVLVVDRLVNVRVIEYARRDAERIFVGKTPGGPTTSQAEINRILVREAQAGKIVARLKGGDPFIFGRAAEEMAACQAIGIDVEVVPGITAAHACAARIGLPVTLRERVRQFSIVTGATAEGEPNLDWQALAADGAAFAVYMGVGNAPLLRRNLLAAGANADTPVVIVENGTLESERAVTTTLADLTDAVTQHAIASPAVIFIGLDWDDAGLCRPESVIVHLRRHPVGKDQAFDEMTANAEAAL
jgi:uroporphyrin-III C-methyltransferase / precorrin-2 dehydrogenase / sirohydrochlorin ferrochelatase